jgi:hypothetical protein
MGFSESSWWVSVLYRCALWLGGHALTEFGLDLRKASRHCGLPSELGPVLKSVVKMWSRNAEGKLGFKR